MRTGKERAGKTPEFSAGNTVPVEIRQKNVLRKLQMRVTGNVTVTGGDGAGSWHEDAAARIARRLAVEYKRPGVANDGAPIDVVGVDLFTHDALFKPKARTQTGFTAALTAGSTHAFDVTYDIPFFPYGIAPQLQERFALDTMGVDDPLLRVTWGNASDLAYGNTGGVFAFTNVQVQVYEEVMQGVVAPVGGWWPLIMRTSSYRVAATVAGENHELPGWRDGQELFRTVVTAARNGAGDVGYRRSNSVLTSLGQTINGRTEFEMTPGVIIQGDNEEDYLLSAPRTGVYVLDYVRDEDARPFSAHVIQRGLRPYITFDATLTAGQGDHIIRTLAIGTAGRLGR